MDPAPGVVSFRPTVAQACVRGAWKGAAAGLGVAVVIAGLAAGGVPSGPGLAPWLIALTPLALSTAAGAAAGVAFGRGEGTDFDDWGIRSPAGRGAPWSRIEDLHTERRGGRICVALRLDSGQVAQLKAPYDGRWLAGDREFEHKLFMIRNTWETHRSFSLSSGFPARRWPRG